jgi:hypothetical protein
MWNSASSPEIEINAPALECSNIQFDDASRHSIPQMFSTKPTRLAVTSRYWSKDDIDGKRSHYRRTTRQHTITRVPQEVSSRVHASYSEVVSSLSSTFNKPGRLLTAEHRTAESTGIATDVQDRELSTQTSTEGFVTTEISLVDISDYTGLPSFAVISAAVGAVTMLALMVVLIGACLRNRKKVKSAKAKPIQDHEDTMKWLHSRFCTESPDQSIHYEEIATERNDQFESNSSTGHPERRNGFFVPEHDFSPINTSPHSLQEKKDHAFSYPIRSQGFSKEAHRMIYERPNGETPVYSSIRKAKLCKFNDIDSQAEENSSQPKV